MKTIRWIISMVLVFSLLCCWLFGSIAEDKENPFAAIERMVDCVNAHDWEGWAKCYAEEFRSDRLALINDALNMTHNIGILTVNHMEIIDSAEMSNEYILQNCPELSKYNREGRLKCYWLKLDINVNESNEFYSDGISYQLAGIVKIDDEWMIGAMTLCSENLISSGDMAGDRVKKIKESNYTELMLYFPASGSMGEKYFTAELELPVRRKFLANSAVSRNESIPYLVEFRMDTTEDHSVYYLNDGNGEIVGAVGYAICNSMRSGTGLIADYSTPESLREQSSYSDVFLQEFPQDKYECLNFNSSFIEVLKTDETADNVTIITRSNPWMLYRDEYGNQIRNGSPFIVIASYEPTLGIFVIVELNPVFFNSMEIMDIAASLRINKQI